MTDGAHRSSAPRANRRGLWQAMVEADEARRSGTIELGEMRARPRGVDDRPVIDLAVIDLAGRSQAHLGYLERVGASTGADSADAGDLAIVVDLAEHRSRRALIA